VSPLRVLHFAYEDPTAPGAGGGSLRTREIARRVVASGAATWVAVCRGYPGARTHVTDGVRYEHIGPGFLARGPRSAAIGYFLTLPFVVRRLVARHRPDVIVEDFGAPVSTIGIGRFTRRPVVGVVQWLNAADKARQYRLPFKIVEDFGLRAHRRLIAVSDDLAADLRRRVPHAHVTVIRNGVDDAAFGPLPPPPDGMRPGDIAYLGRLEIAQKGLDLLLEAYASIAAETEAHLVIAGDGPDRRALEQQVRRAGIEDGVRFIGRLDGPARLALLKAASVTAMPSRFETFGIVAAESAAVGTPIVAFDIPALRELVRPGETGIVVPPWGAPAFGRALLHLASDTAARDRLVEGCLALGSSLRWSSAADATLRTLREATDPARP
jgi:glycosyltransferase involved in cell wall biosynthesis